MARHLCIENPCLVVFFLWDLGEKQLQASKKSCDRVSVADVHDDLRRQISALTDYNPQPSSEDERRRRKSSIGLKRRTSRMSRQESKEVKPEKVEVKKLVEEEGAETGNVYKDTSLDLSSLSLFL